MFKLAQKTHTLSMCLLLAIILTGCAQPAGPSLPQTPAPTQTAPTVAPLPSPEAPAVEPGVGSGAVPGVEPGQEPGKPVQPPPDSPITSKLGPTLEPQPEVWQPTPIKPDWKPQPGDEALSRGPVFLDQTDLLVLESFPPQYRLHLKGSLPTVCHQLRVAVPPPDDQKRIQVDVYSLVEKDAICIQVLAPFEVTVPLEGLPTGSYSVWVNGEKIGEMMVP